MNITSEDVVRLATAASRAFTGDWFGAVATGGRSAVKIVFAVVVTVLIFISITATLLNPFTYFRFSGAGDITARVVDGMVFPVPNGSFTDTYGADRINNGVRVGHEGIDIFADRNTPIYAHQDMRITKIGWNGLGGWRILFESLDGKDMFYYAHLENYAPNLMQYKDKTGAVTNNPGITVKAGELVGFVGSSGGFYNSSPVGTDTGTPPHLHFQMWINSKLTNPYNLLKKLNR